MQTLENKRKVEEEFYEYFSFGKYLELHQRVEDLRERLWNICDKKKVKSAENWRFTV